MRRDDDYLRDLIFEIEAAPSSRIAYELGLNPDVKRLHHIDLLLDVGFVVRSGDFVRLTNYGHDYISSIRDDTVWHRTKQVAADVGGVGLEMLGKIAFEIVKQRVEETTGIKL